MKERSSVGHDIGGLLAQWPYDEQTDLMVRRVFAPDGELRLQIRLELGVMELCVDGRPDGQQPDGFASLLDRYLDRIRREMDGEPDDELQLDHDDCEALQRESMQFYHRRIAWLKLGEFEAAAADAEHNLAIMDLLRDHAADRLDWLNSEQYRAFVLSHWTRARTMQELERGDQESALEILEDGIEAIVALYRDDYQRPELAADSTELKALLDMRRSLRRREALGIVLGGTLEQRLERELHGAVEREDYEQAARLRDELAKLRQS